jgi:hypothetical protein
MNANTGVNRRAAIRFLVSIFVFLDKKVERRCDICTGILFANIGFVGESKSGVKNDEARQNNTNAFGSPTWISRSSRREIYRQRETRISVQFRTSNTPFFASFGHQRQQDVAQHR